MWVLPYWIHATLAKDLNSRLCAEVRTASIIASVRNNDTREREFLRSYPEVVNYLLKQYAAGQAMAGYDTAILFYVQPSNMNPHLHTEYLVVE